MAYCGYKGLCDVACTSKALGKLSNDEQVKHTANQRWHLVSQIWHGLLLREAPGAKDVQHVGSKALMAGLFRVLGQR
jgi:hypothetical protein